MEAELLELLAPGRHCRGLRQRESHKGGRPLRERSPRQRVWAVYLLAELILNTDFISFFISKSF